MTRKNIGKEWTWSPKYYYPSRMIVDHLDEELRNLEVKPIVKGGQKLVRKKELQRTGAKYAKDVFQKVFQSFVDLVYYLEFIEDHPETHELYQDSLKELFGIYDDDSSPQRHHHKNRSGSLFVRFLSATLFNKVGSSKEFDFRTALAHVMIFQAFEAMRSRLMSLKRNDELDLFNNNIINATLWSKLLSARYDDKSDRKSRHRIGYCIAEPNS